MLFAWTAQFREAHLSLIPRVKKMGADAIEIPMFEPASLPTAGIRKALESADLDCTVCAILPQQFNPISPDRTIRKEATAHLSRCILAAKEMGAKLIGGPLCAPIGYLPDHRPTSDEFTWATEAFQSIAETLEANEMVLSIEPVNRSETFFLRTAEDAMRLCEAIGTSRIGVTVDTFHANIEERNIANAIVSLGTHLRHIHASENDRGPLGQGHVPFDKIIASLKKIGYQGYLTVEGFGYAPDEPSAPGRLWAYTDVDPDHLASEGVRYLSTLIA